MMNFVQIDQLMKRTGLASEPAFDYLHFLVEGIPSPESRRILGLYFPEGEKEKHGFGYLPPSTIILPPDASEFTLYHELGHRYNDYYYNDLSEDAANKYAEALTKNPKEVYMTKIIERSVTSTECAKCPEGLRGAARLCPFCELGGYPVFKVRALVKPGVRGRYAAQVAMTGGIRQILIRYDGIDQYIMRNSVLLPDGVVKIPAGEWIDVYVSYTINNPAGGTWSVAITMIGTNGEIPNFGFDSPLLPGTVMSNDNKHLDDLTAEMQMPSHDITLRFQAWGNLVRQSSFSIPQSQW